MTTMIFNNGREMAEYFIRTGDDRQWVDAAKNIPAVRYLFRDMFDKYVRGKNILAQECAEFQEAKQNAINAMAQAVESKIAFPCKYTCKCVYTDYQITVFKVRCKPVK